MKKIHALIDNKVSCGITPTATTLVVGPKRCQYVTCNRCIASLKKI